MTIKKIKSSDILGDNYYIYNLTSSNYTPNLNGSITITCTVKNIYGDTIANKSIQLYQNDTAVGSATTTNNNGVATWTITCSTAGIQKFSVKDTIIEVFVDTTSKIGHNHTTSDITNFPEIPTKTSDLTNDSGYLTSHQDISNKENVSNKSSSIVTDTGSTVKYPTIKAIEDYAEPKKETGTFTELISLINNTPAGGTLTLEQDYKNSENLTGNMLISNEIHINGNGHILDFNNKNYYFQFNGEKSSIENWIVEHFQYTIFSITFKNIIIDNCIFRNSNSSLQSTHSLIGTSSATNFLMVNCQFYNIQAPSLLLITLSGAKQYIKNCIFYNNYCHNVIFSNGGDKPVNNTVSCVFENNRVYDGVIKHNGSANKNTIVDCIFNNNIVLSSNGSAINCKETTVLINNKYLTTNDTVYPTTLINKDYLIEHQDISGKANTIDLGEVAFSNDYEDLDNLPIIPTAYTHPSTHPATMITGLSTVATSGSYNDLGDKPSIPTKTSDLTNDSGYLTSHQDITGKEDKTNKVTSWSGTTTDTHYPSEKLVKNSLDNKANSTHNHTKNQITDFPTIPTKTSDLTNDSNFISTSSTNGLVKNNGTIDTNTYLTTSVASSTYVAKESGKGLFSGSYNDLTNKPTIPNAYTHPSTHSSSMITDSNTHNNIGNTANTLENIITNIDTKLGSLANVDLVEVTSSLGTASANTMNKLYLVAETTGATNDNYEIFVTVRTGTSGNYSYSWEKVDTARIDLSNYLTTANAQQTYVAKESGKGLSSNDYTTSEKNKLAGLHTVATSGSYNDLTNKPSFTQDSNISSSSTESYPIGTLNISGSDVTIYGKDTNTVYEHPTPPTLGGVKTYGLYKTTIDAKGHIINAGNIEASDLPSHTHTISNVTNLQSTLNGKANTSDLGNLAYEDDVDLTTHDVSELTDTNDTAFTPKTHSHGNINNDGTITTVKTIDSNANIGTDYFIIRDNNDSNSTKSANVLDVLNKIVLDLIDEGDS